MEENETVVSRAFNVFGNITQELAQDFSEWCLQIEAEDVYFRQNYPEEPLPLVLINIASFGGECSALDMMMDALELLDCTVVTRALGYVASCGLWLFALGDIRLASSNVQFMYHTILYSLDGRLIEHRKFLENSRIMQKRYDNILLTKTTMTEKMLKSHVNEDWWFDRDTALKYHLVTHDCKLSELCMIENIIDEGCDECEGE